MNLVQELTEAIRALTAATSSGNRQQLRAVRDEGRRLIGRLQCPDTGLEKAMSDYDYHAYRQLWDLQPSLADLAPTTDASQAAAYLFDTMVQQDTAYNWLDTLSAYIQEVDRTGGPAETS